MSPWEFRFLARAFIDALPNEPVSLRELEGKYISATKCVSAWALVRQIVLEMQQAGELSFEDNKVSRRGLSPDARGEEGKKHG